MPCELEELYEVKGKEHGILVSNRSCSNHTHREFVERAALILALGNCNGGIRVGRRRKPVGLYFYIHILTRQLGYAVLRPGRWILPYYRFIERLRENFKATVFMESVTPYGRLGVLNKSFVRDVPKRCALYHAPQF